jgi:putative N6-adenine-specific DNA methylase
VVAPGFEAVLEGELRGLGIEPGAVETGGVAFSADDGQLFAANLHLRSASTVLVRVARFRATSFAELERRARQVPWEAFVPAGASVSLRVTCRKSRLYHSDAVAERIAGAIARRVPGVAHEPDAGSRKPEGTEVASGSRLPASGFAVRLAHDECLISADASGDRLHRRGYRLATAKAPLRETAAAAMLLALGYDGTAPLVDPMCGSGTIAIEAALIARRIAPGLGRRFACERWPSFGGVRFEALREAARAAVLAQAPAPILASDRDAGAIEAAVANATRAGVGADITFSHRALSNIEPPPQPGLLVTNPPYGARVGDRRALRDLYAQLGNVARGKLAGWSVGFLSVDRALEGQLRLPLEEVLRFRNGGIPVRLVRAHPGARS